jgi:hypothetical protein
MKIFRSLCLASAMSFISFAAISQSDADTAALLGLPGDNLDLYAVLDLFQKSKTIEAFEQSLNDEKLKINNLDLDLDKKIDFIKVVTEKEGDAYRFILRVDVSKKESQDVAVILLNKDKDKKVSLQMVGDKDLYGKDYVIEPKGNSSVTANPGYVGPEPVTKNVPATSTVVVESVPIVQYVYSPVYVPYVPPYHYGYYPPYFAFATVIAVGIYRSNNYYHHHGYYGGHYGGGNTVIINNNNRNSINHYNNTRNTSNTVANNKAKGGYGNASNRQSPSASTRPSTSNNRAGNGASASNRQSPSTSNRQSPSASTRQSPSASTRQSSSASSRPSTSNYSSGGRSMNSGGGGAARSGGGGRRR